VVFLGENEWIIEYGVCVEYPVLEEDTQDCMDERVHNGGKRKVLGTTHDQLVSRKPLLMVPNHFSPGSTPS
jgi:hypothetical protein